MRILMLVTLLACACGPAAKDVRPLSNCGSTCVSNLQCQDLSGTCRFCSFGTCRSVSPEFPVSDAGADAQQQNPDACPGPLIGGRPSQPVASLVLETPAATSLCDATVCCTASFEECLRPQYSAVCEANCGRGWACNVQNEGGTGSKWKCGPASRQ